MIYILDTKSTRMKKKSIYLLFSIIMALFLMGIGLFIYSSLTFQGTIVSVSDNSILVEVTDNSIVNGLYSVTISDNTKLRGTHLNYLSSQDLAIGDQVKIMFSGSIFESYPARIFTCYYIWILDD